MASVELDTVHIHDLADPSGQLTELLTSLRESSNRAAAARTYAGGRRRSVSRPGLSTDLDVGLAQLPRTSVNTLRDWAEAGTLLCLRDPRGRVSFGHAFGIQVTEVPGADEGFADVTFTFNQITYDQAV